MPETATDHASRTALRTAVSATGSPSATAVGGFAFSGSARRAVAAVCLRKSN